MDPRRFHDAGALLKQLAQEDAQRKYLYRGQTRRHPPYRFPDENDKLQDVEALYPNDVRFIRDLDASAVTGPDLTAAREAGRDRRDKFMLFLRKGASEGRPQLAWLKEIVAEQEAAEIDCWQWLQQQPGGDLLMDPARTRQAPYELRVKVHEEMWRRGIGISSKVHTIAWSLAQHYELATALVDVTDDVNVALWFATHEWNARQPLPAAGSEGVVYRFDREQLEHALKAQFLSMLRWALEKRLPPPPPFFVQEIANIPASCALRPARQRGFSVYGFDQKDLVQFITERRICEVFTFAHGAIPDLGIINRDYLAPAQDPFDAVLAEWRQQA